MSRGAAGLAVAIRVVVVDDHPLVRAGIVSVLRKSASCQVVGEADSAEAALRVLQKSHPDLVLLDLKLGQKGGPHLVTDIAELAPYAKVVVLTAYEEVGLAREALRQGAQGYLLKGVSGAELVRAIQHVTAGHRVIDPALATLLWELEVHAFAPTQRELQILRLLMEGRPNKEIAGALQLSVDTVKFHLKHLYRQLQAKSRAEAVMAGTKLGYLEWVNHDAPL